VQDRGNQTTDFPISVVASSLNIATLITELAVLKLSGIRDRHYPLKYRIVFSKTIVLKTGDANDRLTFFVALLSAQ
jgi:hypothetical protein